MTKKPDDKQTHKLTNQPEARAYLIEALALAFSPEEIVEHLQSHFAVSIVPRTVWYHSLNSKDEILTLRSDMNKSLKERFPFANVCVRISELQRLYYRTAELENQMTYSSDKSEGRNMLKESIEIKAKILKQINEEIEPFKIQDASPRPIYLVNSLPGLGETRPLPTSAQREKQ